MEQPLRLDPFERQQLAGLPLAVLTSKRGLVEAKCGQHKRTARRKALLLARS